ASTRLTVWFVYLSGEIDLIFFGRRGSLRFRFGPGTACLLGAHNPQVARERKQHEYGRHGSGSDNSHYIRAHRLSPSNEDGSTNLEVRWGKYWKVLRGVSRLLHELPGHPAILSRKLPLIRGRHRG